MRWYRQKKQAFFVLLIMATLRIGAQARVDATGRPLLVMDDSLAYRNATLVYKSAGEEFYVPDMTEPDWVRSRFQQLATSGAFTIYVYAYHVGNHGLHGQMVDISLTKKTASIYDFANPKAPPTIIPLANSDSPLMAAINLKIIPLVKAEVRDYNQLHYGPPPPPVGTYSPATH
jgi:hypothetical protein